MISKGKGTKSTQGPEMNITKGKVKINQAKLDMRFKSLKLLQVILGNSKFLKYEVDFLNDY
jgi:hypothetical protein